MVKAKLFKVNGMVQGVGYRYFTIRLGERLGLKGYAKNLYDGSVEVYAYGEEEYLDNLQKELAKGPAYSRVDSVEVFEAKIYSQYQGFEVEY